MEETTSPKRRATRRQAAADTTPKLSEYGHVQPQALEFEEAVLGALMIDSDAIGRLGGMLKPESFYDKRNQLLFEAIQQMDLADRPIDILTVTEYLRTKGNLDEVGGPVYIAQLTSKIVSSVNILPTPNTAPTPLYSSWYSYVLFSNVTVLLPLIVTFLKCV